MIPKVLIKVYYFVNFPDLFCKCPDPRVFGAFVGVSSGVKPKTLRKENRHLGFMDSGVFGAFVRVSSECQAKNTQKRKRKLWIYGGGSVLGIC